MKEGWETYETEVDGQLCSICAHLALREAAPDPNLGFCYVVRVGLLVPCPRGLVEREEVLALDAIERELDDGLTGMAGAAYAGHITGGGTRDFFFYGPMAELLEPVLEEMRAHFPHYQIVGGAEEDPNWEQFLFTICPAEEAPPKAAPEPEPEAELQPIPIYPDLPAEPEPAPPPADALAGPVQAKIDKRLEQLLAAGDMPERERPVSHWIAFKDEELRQQFLAQVNHGEFEQETLETKDDGALKWWARLEKPQTTDAPAVRATVSRLARIAADYGGEYDALETCVSKRV